MSDEEIKQLQVDLEALKLKAEELTATVDMLAKERDEAESESKFLANEVAIAKRETEAKSVEIERLEGDLEDATTLAAREQFRANNAESMLIDALSKAQRIKTEIDSFKAYQSYVYTLLPISVVSFEEYAEGKRSGEAIDTYQKVTEETKQAVIKRKLEQEFKDKISRKDIEIAQLHTKVESLKAKLEELKRA